MPDPSWNLMPGPSGHTNCNKNSHLSYYVFLLPLFWKMRQVLGKQPHLESSWGWWHSCYHISLFDNWNMKWLKKTVVKKTKGRICAKLTVKTKHLSELQCFVTIILCSNVHVFCHRTIAKRSEKEILKKSFAPQVHFKS